MNINVREREGVTILDIEGKIIGHDALDLKRVIDEIISTKKEGEVKLLLNLAGVPMMDSSGLGVIVAAYTSVQRKKGKIALLNLGKSINNLIVMAKLITIFQRYDDEDTAIAELNKDG